MRFYVLGLMVLLGNGCTPDPPATPVVEETIPLAEAEQMPLHDLSIFHLPAEWTAQTGETMTFRDLRGRVLVVVMIYTSCQASCPRLVADMRNIESAVSGQTSADTITYVLVSIDPETDTAERLKVFAADNKMEGDQWLFFRSTPEDTREFANVLAVKYKRISPIDFSHSNIISVFDAEGVLQYQQEGLGVDNDAVVEQILAQVQ